MKLSPIDLFPEKAKARRNKEEELSEGGRYFLPADGEKNSYGFSEKIYKEFIGFTLYKEYLRKKKEKQKK